MPKAIDDGGPSRVPDDLHWAWYLVGLLSYVALAFASLSLRDNVVILNWIVGPLFPLIALYLVPTYIRTLLGRDRA